MKGAVIVAGYAIRESVRRRVFPVVLVLTAVFLGLYGFGVYKAYQSIDPFSTQTIGAGGLIDTRVLFSATLFGLSIFAVLFLGTVLAIFLTHAVVRGDAERGLLQPLVVRPVGRAALLAGRFGAAVLVCAVYVVSVYAASLFITHWVTGWWPDRIVLPAVELAAAIAVIVAISLFGSIVFSAIANGIAIFMIFGAGLVAGLLGQIGEALNSGQPEDHRQRRHLGAPVRGSLPGRTERDHGRHGGLHEGGALPRAFRRRPAGRRVARPLRHRVHGRSGRCRPDRVQQEGPVGRPLSNQLPLSGGRVARIPSYSQNVWELDRALEDDSRAADLFAWLGTAGVATWLASFILADSLLPITSITGLGALVFGFVGWRASKHGDPREATNFVAISLAVVLAVLWLFLLGSLLLRLG